MHEAREDAPVLPKPVAVPLAGSGFLIARDTPGFQAGAGTRSPIAQLVRALH